MSKGAIFFVAVTLISALLGFGDMIDGGVGLARVAFFIFALFALIALLMGRESSA